jgi:tRNA 2-thiouridine synthesizing protein C
MTKRIAFLLRRAPYAGSFAMETIDAALVAAVFEQDVTLVFLDDGVYQLITRQDGALLGTKNVGDALKALPAYDIERLIVDDESLQRRGLEVADLAVPVSIVDAATLRTLIAEQDVVLSG